MQCPGCGLDGIAGAAYCPSCGKPLETAESQWGATADNLGGMPANVAGALCYLAGVLTGGIFLAFRPFRHDPFVRFHAFQAIFLSCAWGLMHLALRGALPLVPWTMWHFVALLSSLLSLIFLGTSLLLMFGAYRCHRFKLPLIGDLAEKKAWLGAKQ